MTTERDRTMVNESRAMQDTLLRLKSHTWKLEDRLIAWRMIAAIGWIAFLVMVWLMNSLLNGLKHEGRGTQTSGGSSGAGKVQVRVRSAVGAMDTALRGDPMSLQSIGVGPASETRWTVGWVSASGISTRNDVRDGQLTRGDLKILAGRGVTSGDPSCPPSFAHRSAIFSQRRIVVGGMEWIRRGLKSGMDADEGAAVHGWAAAPIRGRV